MIYFLKRLLPFYIAAILIEYVEVFSLCWIEHSNLDWSVLSLLRMLTITALQVTVVFFYMAIPYVIYLIFLPKEKIYGSFDRTVTFIGFILFLILNIFEEVAEAIFWEEFSSTFNFIAVDYLIYTKEVVLNIFESYAVIPMVLVVIALSIGLAILTRKKLYPVVKPPSLKQKLAFFFILIALCLSSYHCIDIKMAERGANRYNNEISKDGLYSFFSAFIKNELDYDDFYITRNDEENTALLRKELLQNGVSFAEEKNSIKRRITSEKPENKMNVIVVIMESMGYEFFDELHPELIITPHLSQLSKEGIFFSRTYATGTRTVRGLEGISLSIPPLPGMSIVRRKGNENLYSIGSVFAEKGYDNKWLYGGYGYFDNMNYFFGNNGFKVIDRTNLNEKKIRHANVWGVSDEDLYDRAIEEADASFKEGKPFLQVIMNTSNHRPFTYPEGKIDIPSQSGRIGAVKYADFAIGELIKNARTKPWFDKTLFVFIADHGAGSAGKLELNPETHRIPLIFYAPKYLKAARYDYPISQIDTLPTLLGILNVDYESVFYGMDALKPDYKSRYFVSNYQYIGYSQDKDMIVLKPVKAVSYYKGEHLTKEPMPDLLFDAVSYYQHAADWRDHYKRNVKNNK